MDTFSDRFGYKGAEAPITIREDAPKGLREALIMLAYDADAAQRSALGYL